jgi:hypothetical protein
MNETDLQTLTDKERFWYEHARQASQRGESLSEYARAHSLNIHHFYNYRAVLRKKGLLDGPPAKAFVKVRADSPVYPTVIVLPNGIRFETQCPAGALAELVKELG